MTEDDFYFLMAVAERGWGSGCAQWYGKQFSDRIVAYKASIKKIPVG